MQKNKANNFLFLSFLSLYSTLTFAHCHEMLTGYSQKDNSVFNADSAINPHRQIHLYDNERNSAIIRPPRVESEN